MKKDILNRYDKTVDGKIIIKISTKKIEDIFNHFDKNSSFLKKDLNSDLAEYIIDSVKEIGNEDFVIKFYFDEKPEEELLQRVSNSFDNFFNYLEELEKTKMKEQVKNAFIFMIIGLFFVACALLIGETPRIANAIISEGIMVAGWVSLWEAMATLLIKWWPLRKTLQLYKRITLAPIEFYNESKE